jgi:predicted dehydrogenase
MRNFGNRDNCHGAAPWEKSPDALAHLQLAKSALKNGKHIFADKPFTSTSQQAEELIELAHEKHLNTAVCSH